MPSMVVIGAQWGDEGKGKVVDLLARDVQVVVRYQGGNNAGHTLVVEGHKTILHLIPSGILQSQVRNVIARGVVVDPEVLVTELDALLAKGALPNPSSQLVVSAQAGAILPYHRLMDRAREARLGRSKIGTTGRGIGPAYEDVASRRSIRMGDLLDEKSLETRLDRVLDERNAVLRWLGEEAVERGPLIERLLVLGERLAPHIGNAGVEVRSTLAEGGNVLFEGAQGALLDVLHGTYPFVTSSHTIAGAVATGVGVAPRDIGPVVGIVKAYTTRVGAGPFPTELDGEMAERIRELGGEYGSTTGRPRRCGWLDLEALRFAHGLNGFACLALTKLDVLTGLSELKICVGYRNADGSACTYETAGPDVQPVLETLSGWTEDITGMRRAEDLPAAARRFIARVEEVSGVPVGMIGVGAGRDQSILVEDAWPGPA